jgi:hypothetical protein
MEKSRILLVTICSNQKIQGGDAFKEASPYLLKILPELADELKNRRASILGLIQSGLLNRDGLILTKCNSTPGF